MTVGIDERITVGEQESLQLGLVEDVDDGNTVGDTVISEVGNVVR